MSDKKHCLVLVLCFNGKTFLDMYSLLSENKGVMHWQNEGSEGDRWVTGSY